MRLCNNCGAASHKHRRCTRCDRAYYCNAACQMQDWQAVHKARCVPLFDDGVRAHLEAATVALNKIKSAVLPEVDASLTEVRESAIKGAGRGLFAAKDIPADTVVAIMPVDGATSVMADGASFTVGDVFVRYM